MWTDSVHISLTQLLDGPNYMALLGLKQTVNVCILFQISRDVGEEG